MGGRVSITYEEHRGHPDTCFGETNYFVTGVKTGARGLPEPGPPMSDSGRYARMPRPHY